MGYDIARLTLQASSAVYAPLKDLVLYLKNKAKFIRDLEDNLTKLTAEVITIYSRKQCIDRILEMSVSKEKTDEYDIILKQIEVFHKRYTKFISKYQKACNNLPSLMEEAEALNGNKLSKVPNASTASLMIDDLQARKPTILTHRFLTLAKLSKDVVKLHDLISRVTDRVKAENLMLEKKPELVQMKHDDIDLPSLNEYVNKVLGYLHQDVNQSIGITGLIGVGKTTVMRKLNNQLKDKQNIVIWITYPKELDVEDRIVAMIQDEIMARLKLNQEKANSIEQNADIISTSLCNKKYIVLIDQVSSVIELDKVGIHKQHSFGKVVLASSNNKIIKQMTNQHVEIRTLSNVDAMDLFQRVCGKIYDSRIKYIADRIIESCGGLPLVIKLVALHLKGEDDEQTWNDVKRMLQSKTKSAKLLKLGGIGNAYKLVYDALEENYIKKCLLFGALFPNDYKIEKDYLVECWMAEKFIDTSHDIQKLRTARDNGSTVLRELTDRYLLERCSDNHVKVPVYFKQVALEQQYPEEENCVIWVPENNKLLKEENWRTATRMSLVCCKSKLPEKPEGHNISTLLLQRNQELATLGDSFFLKMHNLRVLDLHKTGIKSLPTSISVLVNLVTLYLNGCSQIVMLPPQVKELKKLEFLDIRGTSIQSLPREISDLIFLRCLRVSFAHKRCNRNSKGKHVEVMIPPDIISCLQWLEELTIETGCCCQEWNNIADQVAKEVATLQQLTTLHFTFPSVCSLQQFISTSKSWKNIDTNWGNNTFRSFKIFIGCSETRHPYGLDISGFFAERQLRFSTEGEISSVKKVLKQANAFELVGHSGLKSLSDFDFENTGALKVCIVGRCNNLLSIVDDQNVDEIREESAGGILQCLEKLHLFDLQLLQSIWKGSVSSGSLSKLKILTLYDCPKLTEILDHTLAKALSSLKHLKVENCSRIVEIVKVEIQERENVSELVDISDILNKVEIIELVNLPELQSICRTTPINWKSLREIVIIRCIRLRNLSLTRSNAEKIESIKCEASWWTALEIPDEDEQHLRQFFDEIVTEQQSEGESSSIRRPANPQSSNNIESQTYNVYRRPEEVMSTNDGFIELPTSNISGVCCAASPEEETPIHEYPSASNVNSEAPTDEILYKAKSKSCQLSNINAALEKGKLSLSEERLVKNGSIVIR